jgi:hypothetical protein
MTQKLSETVSRKFFHFRGYGLTHESEDSVGELLLTSIVSIVGDVLVQDGPKSLNRIEMWAIWR